MLGLVSQRLLVAVTSMLEQDTRRYREMDAQVVSQHAKRENQNCKEVASVLRAAPKDTSDGLVPVFFSRVSVQFQLQNRTNSPFLATMFHAVGLKAILAKLSSKLFLLQSTLSSTSDLRPKATS